MRQIFCSLKRKQKSTILTEKKENPRLRIFIEFSLLLKAWDTFGQQMSIKDVFVVVVVVVTQKSKN